MSSSRSKPFSGKKKKEQLQLKKQIKNLKLKTELREEFEGETDRSMPNPNKETARKGRLEYNYVIMKTSFITFSLKSNWDVIGSNTINPRNINDYQKELVQSNDVITDLFCFRQCHCF